MTAGVELRLHARRRRYSEDVVKALLGICALISVATTVGIVVALFVPAFEFFGEVSPVDFFTGTEWAPLFEPAKFGVLPLIAGTLLVTGIASVVAMPLGLGAAIYLSEYASPRTRGILKPALEVLAGIPTIVFGYFALTFVTPLLRDIGIQVDIFNTLAAGLVMGVMLMPIVASLSEDAMAAVPRDLRDGAYALGSTKVQVATRIVVPAAVSGIVASFVLAISRAIGETMIVLIAMGQQAKLTFDPRAAAEAMTAFIAATGAGDVPDGLDRVQDDLRRRCDAVRADPGDELRRDQARAQVPRGLRMSRSLKGALFQGLLLFSLFIGFLLLVVLIFDVFRDGLPYLDLALLTNPPSSDPEIAGARPAILATLYMGLLLLLFVVPIGVGTALYLEEYADKTRWYNRLLEINIQNLAAVPSIVYGILGLAFLVRGIGLGRVLLAGAMILTLLVLPTVIIAAREAIRSVPDSIRQGAYALGATQWQVVSRQVLPAAIPGIATGSILALSRAIGETAPLIMIGAVTYISFDPTILGPFTALPIQIYSFLRLPQDEFKLLAAASIIVLLVLLLTLNAFAIFLRNRYRRTW